jgi:hypothetical protein
MGELDLAETRRGTTTERSPPPQTFRREAMTLSASQAPDGV